MATEITAATAAKRRRENKLNWKLPLMLTRRRQEGNETKRNEKKTVSSALIPAWRNRWMAFTLRAFRLIVYAITKRATDFYLLAAASPVPDAAVVQYIYVSFAANRKFTWCCVLPSCFFLGGEKLPRLLLVPPSRRAQYSTTLEVDTITSTK